MDKEHNRILLSILSMVLIFAIQAIIEHVKKRREEAKAQQMRRPTPQQSSENVNERHWPSIFDEELTETIDKPAPKPASNFTPVETSSADGNEIKEDIVQNTINEDIRRAVIWSEILNRKY